MPTSFMGWFAFLAILSGVGLIGHSIWVNILDTDPYGIKKAKRLQRNSGGDGGTFPTYGGGSGGGGDGGGGCD